jgi:glycerol uptake facilitator-like aquaporin
LVLGIFAICDSLNSEVKAGLKPLMIGFLLWGIGGSFGFNAGYAVNPARDFAPRLFTAMAGWGTDVFT